jgi:hypothetical protein
MIYDTGEYDIQLEIPSDNFVVKSLCPLDLESMNDYLDSIRVNDSNTLIILLGIWNCLPDDFQWIESLNQYCTKHKNPVIVFTGKLTGNDEFFYPQTIKFGLCRLGIFDLVSNLYWDNNYKNHFRSWQKDCDIKRKHKFYWASSKDLYTRRFILAGLLEENLLENNLINYKCVHTAVPGTWIKDSIDPVLWKQINEECNSISHLLPLPAIDDTLNFWQTDIKFYLYSYVGIITDTIFENGVFLSEKVFNAINYQQIFFYVGYHGTLQYLRDQGYYTFDDVFDTSYDSITDHAIRLIAARNSLLDFLKQPVDQIQLAYEKSIPAIKHNKQLLQQQRPDLQFTQYIQDYLNEHRTTATDIS